MSEADEDLICRWLFIIRLLTGKTVIPFATSSSFGMGDSGRLLEEMAGTGEWLDGERSRSSVSESDVQDWVDRLGLAE